MSKIKTPSSHQMTNSPNVVQQHSAGSASVKYIDLDTHYTIRSLKIEYSEDYNSLPTGEVTITIPRDPKINTTPDLLSFLLNTSRKMLQDIWKDLNNKTKIKMLEKYPEAEQYFETPDVKKFMDL